MKKRLVCLFVLFSLITGGCATTAPRSFYAPFPEDKRRQIRSIAVLPASFIPTSHFLTYAKGRSSGVAKGATEGALLGATEGGLAAIGGGPFGILLLPFFLATGAMVGGIGGGVLGGVDAVPAEEAAKIDATIHQALKELEIQKAITERFISLGSNRTPYHFIPLQGSGSPIPGTNAEYKFLKEQGIDFFLEAGVEKVGFSGGSGRDPLIMFFMTSRIRLIQTSDLSEVFADTFSYTSPTRNLSEWAANGAIKLKEAFERGYTRMAETAIEKMFLLYLFKVDSIWSGEGHCMLKPYFPELLGIGFFSHQERFPKIDSLQPTLKWEPFPREKDKEADQAGILKRISDIAYELRIWKGKNGAPDELIYVRQELPLPEHKLETLLEPSTEYFWTVRASFKLGGLKRLTKWSHARLPFPPGPDPCLENTIPLYHYYRFKTPSQKGN